MRAVLKLSAVVLIGVLIQAGIERYAGQMDEAAFTLRIMVAQAQGTPIDDEELIEAASRLVDRNWRRAGIVGRCWQGDDLVPVVSVAASDF